MAQPAAQSTSTGTRRERRKAETRARLLAAARTLFVERGYHATRPQDIAEAADLATGTFYVHFADKREAFQAFSEKAAQELMERVRAAGAESADFEQRLYLSLEALMAYADENPGTLPAAFTDSAVIAAELPQGASLQDQLADSLGQGLRQGMERGALRADADPDVIAHGIVGFVTQALRCGGKRKRARSDLLGEITRFVSRALVLEEEEPS